MIDRIKEELQWLRTVFPVLSAAVAALIAYVARSTERDLLLVIAGSVAAVGVGLLLALVVRIYWLLNRLGKPHGPP